MEQNSQHDQKIESQIRECFGRVAYTHKVHEKCADQLTAKASYVKLTQIVLSVITTSGFLYMIFGDSKYVTIFGAVASSVMLILTLYYREFRFEEMAEKHRMAALKLWDVRESYVSLLVDLNRLGVEEIIATRDNLQNRQVEIYEQAPRTNSTGYVQAQHSLKNTEELTFSDEEIDVMLPQSIRKE